VRWVRRDLARGRGVLTDIVLPDVSGVEVARAALARWPGLRVVFMSGFATEVQLEAMRALSPEPLLAKPFSPDELAARIDRALRAAWPTREAG
jgi:CheY-like chemotaxis protein